MRRHSVFERFDFLAATATVAAHANARAEGFRQRDVKFLIDLICNWIDPDSQRSGPSIKNTQVSRYLAELDQEGYVRLIKGNTRPLYRLTRTGLIELVSRAVSVPNTEKPEHFFYLYYFISSYRPKIFELVKAEGKQFPYALELELQALLDPAALLDREIRAVERQLVEQDARIAEGKQAAHLTSESLKRGLPFSEIVKKWEKSYPYTLNSQKPLSELFAEIPPDLARWELETGNAQRVTQMWIPARAIKAQYLESLRRIKGNS